MARALRQKAFVTQLAELQSAAVREELPFLVIGGWAVCAHGHTRETLDLDILAKKDDRQRWTALLEKLGYKLGPQPEAFGHWNPPDKPGYVFLDAMFVNSATFAKMHPEAIDAVVDGERVLIPTLNHLMALKLHALRTAFKHRMWKDMPDLVYLIANNNIDVRTDSFRELCLKFGNQEIYERLRGHKH